MFNEYSDLLNVGELCDILGVGKNVAYKILNEGNIKAFRTGRTWKIPKVAVEEYVISRSGLNKQ